MIEIVFITNGRSTAKYALESLREQTVRAQIMIIEDRPWLEAVNFGLNHVLASHMLRVDDDMLLHPRAIEFMLKTMPKDSVMHRGQLYEHYSKMVAGRIKIYNIKKVRRIGGFRANKMGKIDRKFEEDAIANGLSITIADKKSPIGLHACAPWEEMLYYESLWGHKKSRRKHMKNYTFSPAEQFNKRIKIIERYNRQHNTEFWKWLKS